MGNNLEDYEGGRDLKALKEFAKTNLGPSCGPNNLDLCDDEKKAQVQKFMAMSASALDAAIAEKDDEMKAAEKELEDLLKSLQAQYEEGQKKKDDTKKQIKESGLGLMKSVLAHRKSAKRGVVSFSSSCSRQHRPTHAEPHQRKSPWVICWQRVRPGACADRRVDGSIGASGLGQG